MHCIQSKCLPSNQTGIKSFLEADFAVRYIGLISCCIILLRHNVFVITGHTNNRDFVHTDICHRQSLGLPIPVDARPKAWVCGRSHVGIVGSNTARGMDVCLL
jgi:hypothetical protein